MPNVSGGKSLTVALFGYTASGKTDEHHARVSLNGTMLGQGKWTGATAKSFTFSIPKGALKSGTNTVKLEALLDDGIPYSQFALRTIQVSYARGCVAVGGQVTVKPAKTAPLRVTGLPSTTVLALDVTTATAPKAVKKVATGGRKPNAYAQFAAAAKHTYVVAALSAAKEPDSIAGADEPGLMAAGRGADYLVITAPSLKTAADGLAAYRATKGWTPVVVTTQDIYDDFSFGVRTPVAIHDFIAYALAHWSPAPTCVVLAGDGSYDYRDYKGTGESLVPPLMTDSMSGLAVSDVRLADVSGDDGVPDVAIGRIPARTPAELTAYVAKVQRYEAASGAWRSQVLLASDDADDGGNFPADTKAVAPLVPGTLATTQALVGDGSTFAGVRGKILGALDSGSLLVNYIGHAGVLQLAADGSGAGLLQLSDVPSLTASDKLPVFFMMTCAAGQFGIPGYQSVAEGLVTDADAGAIAVYGPTAFEADSQSVILDRALLTAQFASHSPVLGATVRTALVAQQSTGGSIITRRTYALLGDPALVVQW